MYLLKENIKHPRMRVDISNNYNIAQYPETDLNVTHSLKMTPKLFIIGKAFIIHKNLYNKVFKQPEHINWETFSVKVNSSNDYVHLCTDESIDIHNLDKYQIKFAYPKTDDPIMNTETRIIDNTYFLELRRFIDKKFIIHFNEDTIRYSSHVLNAKRYGKQVNQMITRETLDLWIQKREQSIPCWIKGCNADFKVVDQGSKKPGLLRSESENLIYEAWERGDDPRRISLVYEKPKDLE